jgi:steroid 5-alpha reductase family enzyme
LTNRVSAITITYRMETAQPLTRSPLKALIIVALAYLVALPAAIVTGYIFRDLHPVLMLLAADIAGTLVIFIFGRFFRNASFYDPYWSLQPLVIALFWIFGFAPGDAPGWRQIIVTALVFTWGLRLTFNWVRGWEGLEDEDWRYRDFRHKSGKWFWFVELTGIELIPTIMVFLGCLSLYPALAAGNNAFNILDLVAIIITAGAILLETAADEQMRSFTKNNPAPGAIMADGLWAYSRHPNYLGEVSFWWGLFFFALASDAAYWWTIVGPLAITLLFTTISVPMMDKRSLARRPAYREHQKKVPALFPRFRRT